MGFYLLQLVPSYRLGIPYTGRPRTATRSVTHKVKVPRAHRGLVHTRRLCWAPKHDDTGNTAFDKLDADLNSLGCISREDIEGFARASSTPVNTNSTRVRRRDASRDHSKTRLGLRKRQLWKSPRYCSMKRLHVLQSPQTQAT